MYNKNRYLKERNMKTKTFVATFVKKICILFQSLPSKFPGQEHKLFLPEYDTGKVHRHPVKYLGKRNLTYQSTKTAIFDTQKDI